MTAFGDLFVETTAGDVWVASPIDITDARVAASVTDLTQLFLNAEWAEQRLLTDVVLLARERGIERRDDEVFAISPHPSFTGTIVADQLVPMSLRVWHAIALQIGRPGEPG